MNVYFDNRLHDFQKVNIISGPKGKDTYKCTHCGMIGYRISLVNWLTVTRKYPNEQYQKCIHKTDPFVGKWLITDGCIATGHEFKKLIKDGVEVQVITPPEGYYNGDRGVWVWGMNEPVKLLWNEFKWANEVKQPRRRKKVTKKRRRAK